MTETVTPVPVAVAEATVAPGRGRRRRYRAGRPGRGWLVTRTVLLLVGAAITLFPFYAMVVLSFKPTGPVTFPDSLLPWPFSTEAYDQVVGAKSVLRWMWNTIVYSVVSVVGVLLFASMAGYAFAKKRFPGKETLFWSFLAMLMVPYHVTMIPTFIIISELNGVDTYWGMIVPTLANAQAVFLMRQFIASLPDSIFEAARLDGCSEWRVYVSIVLPLIKPILATLGVFVFLWHWNDFLWPLIVGQSLDMRTLTTGIASLQQESVPLNVLLAGSVVAFVPIFMAYLVGQRYFQEGVATTGIKG
ncbi:carbohydrate ABC transporter membrane protein 2, CUT1 family [Micromonospora pallida]|uniref:Carbohydrate ABC transporter membrane protein 2, CUT1 family n=1 Tax=Micromonospora pallida TaxID=145854 RepID=A0A1C6RXD7_9ACTN|nr:carbohydrate ABC transporter permease [Micromonospora pallida]SCL21890.1 carbohydrate ABC transporter membrane protein 2, CUT1 family [Micromonospora pallida]